MKNQLLIQDYSGEGLGGEVRCGDFMVSILNYLPRLIPEKTLSMQKHTETDECFILLAGRAMLYTADGEEAPDKISAHVLESGKIYTVPQGIWHSPVLSPDAKILLVEKENTVNENSPRVSLTQQQLLKVRSLGEQLW